MTPPPVVKPPNPLLRHLNLLSHRREVPNVINDKVINLRDVEIKILARRN